MGIHRENGYSASVEGFLVVDGARFRLAKTNAVEFVLAEPCEFTPGTTGEFLIIIDGVDSSTQITMPDGVQAGQSRVLYREAPSL